jgi:hypothetical protein
VRPSTRSIALLARDPLAGVLFMGNSWTALPTWATDWAAANPSIPMKRIATGGWKISDLLNQVGLAASYAPRVIIIEIGLNDITTMTATAWLLQLQWLVASLRAAIPGVKILAWTVPASVSQANTNTQRAIVNPVLRAAVGSWLDGIVPIGDYILDTDPGDGVSNTFLYDNGTPPGHPSSNLNGIILQITSAVLAPFFAGSGNASPSQFSFVDRLGATPSTQYTAQTLAPITGMALGNVATAVHSGAGTFQSVRNGPSDTSSKPVMNGDWPSATVTASATVSPPTSVDETVTIGTTSDTFSAVTGPVASDTFNRANGSPVATEVGSLPYIGPGQISGNKIILGQNAKSFLACDPGLLNFDYTTDVFVAATGVGAPWVLCWGLRNGTSSTGNGQTDLSKFYYVDIKNGHVGYKFSSGALLTPPTGAAFTGVSTGATYTVRLVGDVTARTLAVYINGSLITTAGWSNDVNWNPPAGATYVGYTDENNNANNWFDNLSVVAP